MKSRKRYVQVGLGGRSVMISSAVVETYADNCEMVGFCDLNEGRLRRRVEWARERGCQAKGYSAGEFERMIAETRPDVVAVTTKDCEHDKYLCRAMELGCDVITEKPMTTDEHKCRRILETQKKTGRRCTVTFNYRYSPPRTQIKDLLMAGVIGEVLSVDFHWLLDTSHGADYFRRWHRNKANSGGLLVHKATHHFDLVNWWLSTVPVSVFATGHRKFYLPKTADRLGLTRRTERCHTCPETQCRFRLDLAANPDLKELYLDQEHHDGYFRDRCVFSPEIDIEDSMQVLVSYASGAKMAYSLNAFAPWEGYIVTFNGTKGRLEHQCQETVYINGDGSVPGELNHERTWILIYPYGKPGYEVKIWEAAGGHGGGDEPLVEAIFSANPPPDKYLRAADQRAGAWSILTGVAANHSIASGRQILIEDLVQGIGMPDYPPMPTGEEPLIED